MPPRPWAGRCREEEKAGRGRAVPARKRERRPHPSPSYGAVPNRRLGHGSCADNSRHWRSSYRTLPQPGIELRPQALDGVAPGNDADMPPFENHLLLVGRPRALDEGFGGIVRDDMIVLGNRVQDRHSDVAEIGPLATERELVAEQGVAPHQLLYGLPEVFARERQRVARPAFEHPVRLHKFIVT